MKGGDLFVDGAAALAHRSGMPELLIGATVVSIGTTLPEMSVSAASALRGVGAISYGNAIGSIVCNTALVAAVTITLRPARVERRAILLPILFFFSASALYLYAAYALRGFPRFVGVLLLTLFLLYIAVTILSSRRATSGEPTEAAVESVASQPSERTHTVGRSIRSLLLGGGMIAVGAELLVEGGQKIATTLGVPDSIVALLFISLGTSLPELTTAVTALVKGRSALSLGNVIGANFLNLTLVSGLAAVIRPFSLPASSDLLGLPSSLVLDLPVTLLASLLLCIPTLVTGRVSRPQGVSLLLLYAAFTALTLLL